MSFHLVVVLTPEASEQRTLVLVLVLFTWVQSSEPGHDQISVMVFWNPRTEGPGLPRTVCVSGSHRVGSSRKSFRPDWTDSRGSFKHIFIFMFEDWSQRNTNHHVTRFWKCFWKQRYDGSGSASGSLSTRTRTWAVSHLSGLSHRSEPQARLDLVSRHQQLHLSALNLHLPGPDQNLPQNSTQIRVEQEKQPEPESPRAHFWFLSK